MKIEFFQFKNICFAFYLGKTSETKAMYASKKKSHLVYAEVTINDECIFR